jgi:hypothetical protein
MAQKIHKNPKPKLNRVVSKEEFPPFKSSGKRIPNKSPLSGEKDFMLKTNKKLLYTCEETTS